MSEILIRPINHNDASAVNGLLAAAEAVDRTGEHYNVDDVLEELGNPMIDLASDWVVVEADDRVVAHSRLLPRAPADGELSVSVDGTVHPEYRRRGIGSRLVPMLVARAGDYARERGEHLGPVITGNAPSTNTDLASIFARTGLHPERWSFAMLADLTGGGAGDVASGLPQGYTLHTWEGTDHEEILGAHNGAFVGHYGFTPWSAEMWTQWVADSRALRPELSLLARAADGGIAAYLQTSEYDAVTEATGLREAYVAKVGTLEEHRRRGLATLLLQASLRRYRGEGFDRAALDVDSENPTGALGVYERAGFRTHLKWISYRLG